MSYLKGWIEIGMSNPNIFHNQSNSDIIIRTYDSSTTNKIIVGNTSSNDTPNRVAAMYVYSNNIGIKTMPSSGVDLDIFGLYSSTNGRVASNLNVGYGNNTGFLNLNGDLRIVNTNTNTSNMLISNSNNNFKFSFGDIERIKITNGQGLYLNDNVYATNDVFATAFHMTSDSNMKENICVSNRCEDIQKLLKLKVSDYNFKGDENVRKGFIAQDVESIFPQAITEFYGIIPMHLGYVFLENGFISLPSISELNLCVGDEIVIGKDALSKESIYPIISVNNKGFYISCLETKKVYIHGKMGQLKSVDINQIVALCVSAIQELAMKIL
jgi:hypothetical protein